MKKHIFWLVLAIAMFVYGYIEGNGNSRSDTNAPEMHPSADPIESIPTDNVASARDRKSDQRRDQIEDEVMLLFREALTLIKQDMARQKQVAQSKERDYN